MPTLREAFGALSLARTLPLDSGELDLLVVRAVTTCASLTWGAIFGRGADGQARGSGPWRLLNAEFGRRNAEFEKPSPCRRHYHPDRLAVRP